VFCEKDFPSNQFPWERLERNGVEIRRAPNRQGRIFVSDIEKRMDSRTRLVAVSSVQFVSGFRMDLRGLGMICRRKGALFCVDAIQSLGMVPMDVQECGIDFLSADAHKWLLGPEGIGIFYCRNGLAERLDPALIGWKSVKNEFDFESPQLQLKTNAQRFEEGSQNLLGIIGLGAAVKLVLEVGIENIMQRVQDLGDLIIGEAAKRGFQVITPHAREERGGAISFTGPFNPEAMRDTLRTKGIMVNVRGGGLRVSPHFYNQEQEIQRLFAEIDAMRNT
jgi:selenocysteine lyase/cysteine desulfurase